jgi:hypothetical protein
MKTFSTDGRIPLCILPDGDDSSNPEQRAWDADNDEAVSAAKTRSRFLSLPGRETLDLESISDLWLD